MARPLLVTDRNLAAGPMVAAAEADLEHHGLCVATFDAVAGDPTGSDVAQGVEAVRGGGYDGVIAFGGGSALDAGKAIAFAAHQSEPLWAFEDLGDNWKRAGAAILPVVAIPTTAGTGTEVGRAAVTK